MPKKLIIADSAGVCFGVEKAVSSAEDILDGNKHVDVKSFGPLIHNPQTVDILKKKGLSVINKITKNEKGTVIIRAHGIPYYEEKNFTRIFLEHCRYDLPYRKNISYYSLSSTLSIVSLISQGGVDAPALIPTTLSCKLRFNSFISSHVSI